MSLGFANKPKNLKKAPAVSSEPLPPVEPPATKPKRKGLPKLEITIKDPTLKKGLAKARAFVSSVL